MIIYDKTHVAVDDDYDKIRGGRIIPAIIPIKHNKEYFYMFPGTIEEAKSSGDLKLRNRCMLLLDKDDNMLTGYYSTKNNVIIETTPCYINIIDGYPTTDTDKQRYYMNLVLKAMSYHKLSLAEFHQRSLSGGEVIFADCFSRKELTAKLAVMTDKDIWLELH